jgi:predicted RNA-binding Zn ribbon-like protein
VNLTSYCELAVRLVNTAVRADGERDPLAAPEEFCLLMADFPQLGRQVTRHDLEALRTLRAELSEVFTSAATGDRDGAMQRLNALLLQYPIQPELVRHDGDDRWHMHLAENGFVSDRYAAGAVIALALVSSQFGVRRLGVCAIASCPRVFIDSSPNHSRRYCAEHSASRANVAILAAQQRTAAGQPVTPAAS